MEEVKMSVSLTILNLSKEVLNIQLQDSGSLSLTLTNVYSTKKKLFY